MECDSKHVRKLLIPLGKCQFQHTLPTSRTADSKVEYRENGVKCCSQSSTNVDASPHVAFDLFKCVVLEEEAQLHEPEAGSAIIVPNQATYLQVSSELSRRASVADIETLRI